MPGAPPATSVTVATASLASLAATLGKREGAFESSDPLALFSSPDVFDAIVFDAIGGGGALEATIAPPAAASCSPSFCLSKYTARKSRMYSSRQSMSFCTSIGGVCVKNESHAVDTADATSSSDITVPSSATVRSGPPHTEPTHAPAPHAPATLDDASRSGSTEEPGSSVVRRTGPAPFASALSAEACLLRIIWYEKFPGPVPVPIARVGAQNLSVSCNAPESCASDAPASSSARMLAILAWIISATRRCSRGHSPTAPLPPLPPQGASTVEYAESSSCPREG